jgi:hypothetical protein
MIQPAETFSVQPSLAVHDPRCAIYPNFWAQIQLPPESSDFKEILAIVPTFIAVCAGEVGVYRLDFANGQPPVIGRSGVLQYLRGLANEGR